MTLRFKSLMITFDVTITPAAFQSCTDFHRFSRT
jgi:hypothetical protein